ncbi:hypothetical protein OF83DRAFT_586801 [Amylostereum chailletii]|nr:hypothetical protein OF83DRAFT_586801 [Amylostereum chailletii]
MRLRARACARAPAANRDGHPFVHALPVLSHEVTYERVLPLLLRLTGGGVKWPRRARLEQESCCIRRAPPVPPCSAGKSCARSRRTSSRNAAHGRLNPTLFRPSTPPNIPPPPLFFFFLFSRSAEAGRHRPQSPWEAGTSKTRAMRSCKNHKPHCFFAFLFFESTRAYNASRVESRPRGLPSSLLIPLHASPKRRLASGIGHPPIPPWATS